MKLFRAPPHLLAGLLFLLFSCAEKASLKPEEKICMNPMTILRSAGLSRPGVQYPGLYPRIGRGAPTSFLRNDFRGFQEDWIVRSTGNIGGRANTLAVHPQNENITLCRVCPGGV